MKRFAAVAVSFGLLLGSSAGASGEPSDIRNSAWATAPIVTIDVIDAKIRPYRTSLHENVPVRLVFTNTSGTPNSFILGALYPTLEVSQSARQPRSVIELDPGESRELDVIPRQVGNYALITTLSVVDSADWAGTQRGIIDVLPAVP